VLVTVKLQPIRTLFPIGRKSRKKSSQLTANRFMKDVYGIRVGGISEVFHEFAKSFLDKQI
jgi:hypothetical protein